MSTCASDLNRCNRQQLWSSGTFVAELNSSLRDTKTAINGRNGLEIIVSSNRWEPSAPFTCGCQLGPSVQDPSQPRSTSTWKTWTSVFNWVLVRGSCPVVNTTANDGAAALSWDGQTMIFLLEPFWRIRRQRSLREHASQTPPQTHQRAIGCRRGCPNVDGSVRRVHSRKSQS